MKRVTSPGSMHNTGCLGLVHWDDPEGGYGEEGGRRVQDGEHRYNQISNIRWIIKKAREFQKKHLFLLNLLYQSL